MRGEVRGRADHCASSAEHSPNANPERMRHETCCICDMCLPTLASPLLIENVLAAEPRLSQAGAHRLES